MTNSLMGSENRADHAWDFLSSWFVIGDRFYRARRGLGALPRLATLDLGTAPKRWSRASLDQLRLVAGDDGKGRGAVWRGRLLLPPVAVAPVGRPRRGAAA